jgi:hypothetical protein
VPIIPGVSLKQEDHSPGQPGQKVRLFSKITSKKTIGRMAQVVECQLSKCKALSSTPVPPEKRLIKKEKVNNFYLKDIWS